MKQIINIRKDNKKIKIYFMYDNELYNVMKQHNGFWLKREKFWIFPEDKLESIKKDIESKGHEVYVLSKEKETYQLENPFSNPLVVAVFGNCKVCGKYSGNINKTGVCLQCRLKKNFIEKPK